ncbi:MAG: 5'/3'-nucleotidase SurE [Candidatus Aminicenantes bacterium]|nr:MAG: 5'/3'-nucleotidase SurE [Candidatus Aminicenantes bacterium]
MIKKRSHSVILFLFCTALLLGSTNPSKEMTAGESWPKRVLITNDNGIEDVKLVELARAFSKVAVTYVVAPIKDRSGSTHYLTATQRGSLIAEQRHIGEGIHAYAVDGFPADCVLIALTGIMKDNPPDVVISGINGGPNLGKDWLFSGTVGAARVASFAGVPSIAVSGLDDDMPGAMEAANKWVVSLAQSPLVRELEPAQYITVSIPRVSPQEIKGVRVAERAGLLEKPVFAKVASNDLEEGQELWRIIGTEKLDYLLPSDSDVALYNEGYVVVVPMVCNEHDHQLGSRLNKGSEQFPEWAYSKEKNSP